MVIGYLFSGIQHEANVQQSDEEVERIKSASAPTGSVNKKKGSAANVDITEIRNIDGVSVFMTQVATVS